MAEDERDALELLARMLVGGGYRVPVAGRGTKGALTSSDIAGALGMMRDHAEMMLAYAVATRADGPAIGKMVGQVYDAVARRIKQDGVKSLALAEPADRWRLRMVIHAAAEELVWPERKQAHGVLAKRAKMRKANYTIVHKIATQVLQSTLNGGRREFAHRLFSS